MQLTKICIQDTEISVEVDDYGTFSTVVGEDFIYATTLDELKSKASRAYSTRKARFDVPFDRMVTTTSRDDQGNLTREQVVTTFHVTGRHGSNSNWMVRGNGSTTQESYLRDELRVLTPDECEELLRLDKAATDAEKTLRSWVKEHSINVAAAAENAYREALGKL